MKHYAGDLNYPAGAESSDIYRVQQRWAWRQGFRQQGFFVTPAPSSTTVTGGSG